MLDIKESGIYPLGEIPQVKDEIKFHHIEITLNHPRTVAFVNSIQFRQKNIYLKIWSGIKEIYKDIIYDSDFKFENCRDGTIHMHGVLLVSFPQNLSRVGLISDMVKLALAYLPKKYNHFETSNIKYFDDDMTISYRCASTLIKICTEQEEQFFRWYEYINKTQ